MADRSQGKRRALAFAAPASRVASRPTLVLPPNDSLSTSDEALKTALM
jgi:hypothetical protein